MALKHAKTELFDTKEPQVVLDEKLKEKVTVETKEVSNNLPKRSHTQME